LKAWNSGLFVNFGNFVAPGSGSAFNTDQDPGEPNQWVSYMRLRIRIVNTVKKEVASVIRAYQEQYLNAGPPHPPRKQESKKRPSAAVSSTVVMHAAKSRLPVHRRHQQTEEILQPRDENEVQMTKK
jgi:hypothetical protein